MHLSTSQPPAPQADQRAPCLSSYALPQVVEVLHDGGCKLKWLQDRLQRFVDEGDVLVFANRKAQVDELTAVLQAAGAR